MAISKPMTPSDIELMDPNDGGIEVDLETGETSPAETTVTETEDGGVVIDFGGRESPRPLQTTMQTLLSSWRTLTSVRLPTSSWTGS